MTNPRTLVLPLLVACLTIATGSPASAVPQNVLILADDSGAAVNGLQHVLDLINSFTGTGANVTVNLTELNNGSAMPAALVAGWDVVIVATVSGNPIDAADVPILQSAASTAASPAFIFFTDSCDGCTTASANAVLPILNAVGGWSATLGSPDNTYPMNWNLNGAGTYNGTFNTRPVIIGGAYAPLVGVPTANVIYIADAIVVDGPVLVIAPGNEGSACVLMGTDTTQFFWSAINPPATATAVAADFLAVAATCSGATPARATTWGKLKTIYH